MATKDVVTFRISVSGPLLLELRLLDCVAGCGAERDGNVSR